MQVPCEDDRHVTDNVKHEVKKPFQNYGADLDDIMGETGRGSNDSFSSSRKKKSSSKLGSSRGLMRKMTVKLQDTLTKTMESFKGLNSTTSDKIDGK